MTVVARTTSLSPGKQGHREGQEQRGTEEHRRGRKGVTGSGAELERCWPGHRAGQVGAGGHCLPCGFSPTPMSWWLARDSRCPRRSREHMRARVNCLSPVSDEASQCLD